MSDNLPATTGDSLPESITPESIAKGEAVKEIILNDFQLALEIIQSYQRTLKMLTSPDRDTVRARKLLHKYNVESIEPTGSFKIFLGSQDITTHPDSIEASAVIDEFESLDVGIELPPSAGNGETWENEGGAIVSEKEICPRCGKDLEDDGDEFFIYHATVENIETGEKENVCSECVKKEMGLDA